MDIGLSRKTSLGIIWSSFHRFGVMLISFISNIILARLLSPDDFGCIGLLAIFITISSVFIDGGFGSALIQKRDLEHKDCSTMFLWNIILSLVLYFIMFTLAPFVSIYYKIPLLSSVLRVQGVVLILNAFSIIQTNLLRKHLQFKKLAIINVLASLISVTIAIYLANNNYGIWSLVIQQISYSLFNMIFLWKVTNWYPKMEFSRDSFCELFSFGGFVLLSNFVNTLCNNIQGLLIGRFFTPAIMGYYSQAQKLESVSSTSISSIIDQVCFPVFSEIQDNKIKLQDTLSRFIKTIAYVCFPIMFILILIAKPLIILLYSEVWIKSISYFQILCVAGLAICLQNINYYAVISIGKSKEIFKWTFIKRIIGLGLLLIGFSLLGIWGLLWGQVLTSFTIYIINAYLASKYVGYSLRNQFKDLFPVILVSILSLLFLYFINVFALFNCLPNIYVKGILVAVVFIVLWIVFSYLLRVDSLFIIYKMLRNYL